MSKAKGKIGTLPLALREQINQRLRENRQTYRQIAEWLLSCPIGGEGFPVSTLYEDAKDPVHAVEKALGDWFNSKHYADWARAAAQSDDMHRRIRNFQMRWESSGAEGQDAFMMSVIAEKMESIATGTAKPGDVRNLAYAWCKVRGLKKDDAALAVLQNKLSAIIAAPATGAGGESDYKSKLDLLGRVLEEGFKK